MAQDRPKTVLGSSCIAFFASLFFASLLDRFRLRFGAVLDAKMLPRGATKLRFGGSQGIRDALGIVLVRFSCRLVVRVPFC